MNEPHEHEDETHEDEADGDGADERSFAREALEADERVRRLRESLGRQQAQSVGVFDQFLAGLVELEHTVDEVSELELPQGQRIELLRALSNLMQSAVMGLAREWDYLTDPGDVYGQALDVVEQLRDHVLEQRLETRAKNVAAELGTDSSSVQALYLVATHYRLRQELVEEAGWDPPEQTIRAWLLRHVTKGLEES